MASIYTDGNGNRAIQSMAADGKRRTIRLGKVALRLAKEVKTKVESLNAGIVAGCLPDNETALWVSKLGDGLTAKLAAAGLIQRRGSLTIGELVDSYVARRT